MISGKSDEQPLTGHFETLEKRQDFVKGQYERLWDATYQKALSLIEKGESDINRFLLLMRRDFGEEFNDAHLAQKYRDRDTQRRSSGFIYDYQLVQFHETETNVQTLILDAVKMRELIKLGGGNIQRIIELGAGWGKTLFNLWRFGAPLKAEYYACELTEAGRKSADFIAKNVIPKMNFNTSYFDHYKPDFSFLSDPLPTLVYTHHSLEQIPEVSASLIEAIRNIPGFKVCVHLEPIGWQMPGHDFLKNPEDKRLMKEIDQKNQQFSEKKNQNRNLYLLLKEIEKDGKLKITQTRKYFCSTLIQNATSLVAWEKT